MEPNQPLQTYTTALRGTQKIIHLLLYERLNESFPLQPLIFKSVQLSYCSSKRSQRAFPPLLSRLLCSAEMNKMEGKNKSTAKGMMPSSQALITSLSQTLFTPLRKQCGSPGCRRISSFSLVPLGSSGLMLYEVC